MEEKERYKYFDGSKNMDKCIFIGKQSDGYIDNLSEACDLLNQQDKRIKELESKLRVSNSLNASLSLDYNKLKKRYDSQEKLLTIKLAENSKLTLENQQLKQSQKQLAISKLEDVYQVVKYYNSEANKYEPYIDTLDIEQYINDQIKELKGEK